VQDKDLKNLPNATINIDGTERGVTDSHGQFIVPIKYGITYNLSSSKEGYVTNSAKTQVMAGNMTPTVTLTLDKNFDWGLVSMIAVGLVGIILLLVAIRMIGRGKHRHVMRRNEI